MSIHCHSFGKMPNGQSVDQYVLSNTAMHVSLLTYGARIQSIVFGETDVVLGYAALEDYLADSSTYFGATIGRFGNRIRNGHFSINGVDYTVACNETGRGHLHGGKLGFDQKVFDAVVISDGEEPSVRFSLVSPDGEEGYPGTLRLSVTYTLKTDNRLMLHYDAECDQDTIVNFTNHAYFNLNGEGGPDVRNTTLQIAADRFLPVDAMMIPTGDLAEVADTPFDFRTPKTIGRDFDVPHPQMIVTGGYDHTFVLQGHGVKLAAEAHSPVTGITMQCYTDQPGVQLYTGNFIATTAAKTSAGYGRLAGFCLETQHFPDSPNHPQFPSTLLKKNTPFSTTTFYSFCRN